MSLEKYPFNPVFLSLFHPLLIVAIAFGAKSLYIGRAIGLTLISFGIFMICFCRSAEDQAPDNSINAIGISSVMLTTIDYLFLQNYQPEIRKIGQKKLTSEMSLRERLWWASTLTVTARGIGWKHEPTSHLPPRPTQSRSRFILSQLTWLVLYLIQREVAANIIHVHPSSAAKGPSFDADGWLWRCTALVYLGINYLNLQIAYTATSILGVIVGLSRPEDWPPLFGSPKQAYTVRNVFGQVWHQMLRKVLTTVADFFAQTLHLKKGLFNRFFKLFVVFFFSGAIHYGGDYLLLQNLSGGAIRFFVLQAVAITFEGAVIALAQRSGFRKRTTLATVVGYAWVFAWVTYSFPIYLEPLLRGGIAEAAIFKSMFFHIL